MDKSIFLLLAVLGTVLVIGLVLWLKINWLKKNGREVKTNYRALFFLGITFTGAGTALALSIDNPGMYGLTVMGIIYMILGIANRDKWENKTN